MPGNENQFVLGRAVRTPLEVMLDFDRFLVLVNTEETHVEVVARKFEVVRIATEKSNLLFRSENEPHVGVLLEAVQVVLAALIERRDVRSQTGLIERFFLDFRSDIAPRQG